MCQVLALTNMKKVNLKKGLNNIGNTLLASDDDGFGYAIQGKNGVFGEKTISKKFRTRLARTNHIDLPIVKPTYSSFGLPSELLGPGIFHGRSSTNLVSLENTHPMQMEGWHLIHNGVVNDDGPKYEKKTTNDSEDVLRRLVDSVGKDNPMEAIENHLEGYYAFAAIDAHGRLHICRDGIAPLHIAKSAKLDTYIIGTTDSLILKVAKILDAKIGPIDEIEEEVYMIFEGNKLVYKCNFSSKGYTTAQTRHAATSLHHSNWENFGVPFGESHHRPVHGQIVEPGTRIAGLQPPQRNVDSRDMEPDDDEKTQDVTITRDGVIDISDLKSESEWPTITEPTEDSLVDFLMSSHNDKMKRITENDYYQYREELDNMDASYQIFDTFDKKLTLIEFSKLDPINQELCTIIRNDGTVVDPENYDTPKLPGVRIVHDA